MRRIVMWVIAVVAGFGLMTAPVSAGERPAHSEERAAEGQAHAGGNDQGSENASQAGGNGQAAQKGGNAGTEGDGGSAQGGDGGSAKGSPPGNNGTIKIDGSPFEPGDGDSRGAANRNEPHVGCEFQLELYNYEEGSQWKVEFEGWAPTKGDATVANGGAAEGTWHPFENSDPANGASADGIDHTETYELDFGDVEPHAKQGFHVKATVWVDDPAPQGAEVKHKVFWVAPCEADVLGTTEEKAPEKKPEKTPEAKPTNETDVESEIEGEAKKSESKTDVDAEVLGVEFEREVPARPTEVLGVTLTKPASGPQVLSAGLARTGAPLVGLVLVALMTIGFGAAATRYGRR